MRRGSAPRTYFEKIFELSQHVFSCEAGSDLGPSPRGAHEEIDKRGNIFSRKVRCRAARTECWASPTAEKENLQQLPAETNSNEPRNTTRNNMKGKKGWPRGTKMATDETAERNPCNHYSSRSYALTRTLPLKRILSGVKEFFKAMRPK